MALTNDEKSDLRRRVKREIDMGHDKPTTVHNLVAFGYNPDTIRKYYKASAN